MKATILTLRLATPARKHHNQLQSKRAVFSPGRGFALLCISTLTIVMQAAEPSGFVEEFNGGTTLGAAHGITYAPAPGDLGALFRQACESRVEYPFGTRMPTNGTVEFWVKVERGYGYSNGTLYWSDEGAQIFGTDIPGGDVTYPGTTHFQVRTDGTLRLVMETSKYAVTPPQVLMATGTPFRFNEWHAVGFSFGSQGQHIMVDGHVFASNVSNTQSLGASGNHSLPLDRPTLGESVSSYWANNQWDGGFEGIVDRMRVSSAQQDWLLATNASFPQADSTLVMEEFDGGPLSGVASGITYAPALCGSGAVFRQDGESRLEYPFCALMPRHGTLELWIKVDRGYGYSNGALDWSQDSAQIFGTDIPGGDVTWPGTTHLRVYSDGTIRLAMETSKYALTPPQVLVATGTTFRFNEWHALGVSFGSKGQHIRVDGQLVASNTNNTQWLGASGNHSLPLDSPTIGEPVSGFWANNQWDGGFEGMVDRLRISSAQQDWKLDTSITLNPPLRLPNGQIQLILCGMIRGPYEVQASSDLTSWHSIITATNLTGRVDVLDADISIHQHRFYRAVARESVSP